MCISLPNVGLGGEDLMLLIGAMVCLLAAPWIQLFINTDSVWP